ncbi:HPr family phosphocarrier protein [Alienimonas sp. DA493]|uniref:HPr family phosphocarrier protein n=1 Tax=Alienimonas sp. DA493 TaxID=3373605 RepID=UPI003753E9CA
MADERNPAEQADDVATRTVQVGSPDGLHLRPITLVTQKAAGYPCAVTVTKGDASADAKAMIQLLTLAAACGDEVTVTAKGPEARRAVDEIADLIAATNPE